MIDAALRPIKDRILAPVAHSRLGAVHPAVFTASSLFLTLLAAVAAAVGQPILALALWLVGRLADGLDGAIARAGSTHEWGP